MGDILQIVPPGGFQRQVPELHCLSCKQHFWHLTCEYVSEEGQNVFRPCLSTSICCICAKLVSLESSKTDERGHAVHEECYLFKLGLIEEITAQRKPPRGLRNMKMAGGICLGLDNLAGNSSYKMARQLQDQDHDKIHHHHETSPEVGTPALRAKIARASPGTQCRDQTGGTSVSDPCEEGGYG